MLVRVKGTCPRDLYSGCTFRSHKSQVAGVSYLLVAIGNFPGMATSSIRTQRAVLRTLIVDGATAEVMTALAARGIDCILLKGPSIARRLYDSAELRTYIDADLLVPPQQIADAGAILASLAFTPVANDGDLDRHRPLHAREWRRGPVAVDLHRTVSGCTVPDAVVWYSFAEQSETFEISGATVLVPTPGALALIVTLHAAHNGRRAWQPLADLARALERFDDATWNEAQRLAERVGAQAAFAAGLRLLPEGESRALPVPPTVEVSLRASGAPRLSLGLDWLLRTPGLRGKLALVKHVLFPPRGALMTWRPLARRGRTGLITAYASQPFWLMRHTLPSLLAVRRARRQHA